jgi:large conductance mechanosensitive channel
MNQVKTGSKLIGKTAKGGADFGYSVWKDFKAFIDKGNVVDLAVAVVMATAFTSIVNSLVKDIFTPCITFMVRANLENMFAYLGEKPEAWPATNAHVQLPKKAMENKATILRYGNFVQQIISFLIISIFMFFVVKAYAAAFRRKKVDPTGKDCPFCCKTVQVKAVRCGFCTSALPKEEVDSVIQMDAKMH